MSKMTVEFTADELHTLRVALNVGVKKELAVPLREKIAILEAMAKTGTQVLPVVKEKNKERAAAILKDILVNHLPRIVEGLEKGYADENQVLFVYDHLVRARILTESKPAAPKETTTQKEQT